MRRWLPALLIAGVLVFSVAVYSRLPDDVPIHWGLSGTPDRFGSRLEGAFLMPLIMVVLFAVMQWYPSRDPRAANIAKFRGAYDSVVTASIAMLAVIHVAVLGVALGWQIDMTTVGLAGLGVLLVLIGNLLPLARSNFIFGIRTPWTLSSEQVWTRSHRVGGYSMVAAGVLTIVAAFVGGALGPSIALTSLIVAGLVPVIYSYLIWNRERRGPTND
jgi:uncharacterized membrane protein